MNDFVADTHALLWYLTNSTKLGPNASLAFDEADAGNAMIHIPSIVIAELFYLNEKYGRLIDFEKELGRLETGNQFVLTPFDAEDVRGFSMDSAVREMHDRIVVGVARRVNIVDSGIVRIVW